MNDQVSNPNGEGQVNDQVPADQAAQADAAVTPQVDPNSLFADQLSSITTDDGRQKYADVPTALQSIPHAQSHISELNSKVKQLEEELNKRQGAEELLSSLQQSQQQVVEQPSVTGLDATEIENVVSNILQTKAQQDVAQTNAAQVRSALSEKFGGAASVEFENRAKSLGISVGQLTQMASQSPQVVMELFNAPSVRDPQPTTGGSVNISSRPVEKTQPDYMAKFSGTSSELPSKWAAAKAEAMSKLT